MYVVYARCEKEMVGDKEYVTAVHVKDDWWVAPEEWELGWYGAKHKPAPTESLWIVPGTLD